MAERTTKSPSLWPLIERLSTSILTRARYNDPSGFSLRLPPWHVSSPKDLTINNRRPHFPTPGRVVIGARPWAQMCSKWTRRFYAQVGEAGGNSRALGEKKQCIKRYPTRTMPHLHRVPGGVKREYGGSQRASIHCSPVGSPTRLTYSEDGCGGAGSRPNRFR